MDTIAKIARPLLVIALIGIAGIFFLFFRFYQNDVKALEDFTAAYDKFDQAISDFSGPVLASNLEGAPAVDDLERKADEALVDLKTKAAARISSLIKNDAELMSITLEIANLSSKELDNLKAYRRAVAGKNTDLDRLAKEFEDWTNKRRNAYVQFQELGGLKE